MSREEEPAVAQAGCELGYAARQAFRFAEWRETGDGTQAFPGNGFEKSAGRLHLWYEG